MKAKMFRALLPLAIVFTMVSCSSDDSENKTARQVVTSYNYSDIELKLVQLINQHRAELGLNTLEVINHISYKSEEHNIYMIDNKVVNHDYFEQRAENLVQVLGAEAVGENVAYNYQTAESVLTAWLNSPGHKANIEKPEWTHMGISVTVDENTGKKYYTNMFMEKRP